MLFRFASVAIVFLVVGYALGAWVTGTPERPIADNVQIYVVAPGGHCPPLNEQDQKGMTSAHGVGAPVVVVSYDSGKTWNLHSSLQWLQEKN